MREVADFRPVPTVEIAYRRKNRRQNLELFGRQLRFRPPQR